MPFHGVLPQRQPIFQPQPVTDIGVNDAHAWRLNPMHRHVYNKLHLALAQDLLAAPCGVDPLAMGLAADTPLFVKPIINLAGMSLNAKATTAQALSEGELECLPGCFWSELLRGEHSSTDCLVQDGVAHWFTRTIGSAEKDKQRSLYWQIGVELPQLEPAIAAFIRKHLPGYTGLCNLEMIGGKVIEMHLRGSNGFFDFYGENFIPAWVKLVDEGSWEKLETIPGGYVYSVFGDGELNSNHTDIADRYQVEIAADTSPVDRLAIIRSTQLENARQAADALLARHQTDM